MSPLQSRALALARSRNGSATYAEALAALFGIEPAHGTGRRLRFRESDRPELRSARASLSRCVARLEARGLVERFRDGFRLTEKGA